MGLRRRFLMRFFLDMIKYRKHYSSDCSFTKKLWQAVYRKSQDVILINGLSCSYLPIVIREESEFVVMESIIRKLLILIVADFTETVSSVHYQARNVIHQDKSNINKGQNHYLTIYHYLRNIQPPITFFKLELFKKIAFKFVMLFFMKLNFFKLELH